VPKESFDVDQAAQQLTRNGNRWDLAIKQGIAISYAFRDTAGSTATPAATC